MLVLGCHLSSSKGFAAMGNTAISIHADTFQFFTRNPRGGRAKELDPEDAKKLSQMQTAGQIAPVVAHAPYTINPCSAEERIRNFAGETMSEDLQRMEHLPGNYYNFHPGSHVGQGIEAGIDLIAKTLDAVMFDGQHTMVLLETMAGKGSEIGGSFQHLRQIIDRIDRKQSVGVCLDTCHVHDAGYDIVNDLDGVLEEFDSVIGLERLKALHINDSLNPCGARKDRHAVIGGGYLGLEAMVRIVSHPVLKGLPMILETPNELPGYAAEISLLRSKEVYL